MPPDEWENGGAAGADFESTCEGFAAPVAVAPESSRWCVRPRACVRMRASACVRASQSGRAAAVCRSSFWQSLALKPEAVRGVPDTCPSRHCRSAYVDKSEDARFQDLEEEEEDPRFVTVLPEVCV